MSRKRSRIVLAGLLALSLGVTPGMTVAGADAAKKTAKKKKTPTTFAKQLSVNAAIPDDAAAGPSTPLTSTITVPKKFKGKVVGDVNVTGLQTTGSAAGAASDLNGALTSPGGRTTISRRPNRRTRRAFSPGAPRDAASATAAVLRGSSTYGLSMPNAPSPSPVPMVAGTTT